MDIPVWLGSEATILPADLALESNAAEQSNMAISAGSARTKSPNKVSRLEVFPSDLLPDSREVDSGVSWRGSMESHSYKARAVGAVLGTLWVWVVAGHGVRHVAIDPVLGASDDFLASNLAIRGGVAGSASLALLLDNPACGARFHVVVRNVAAIGRFVPEAVPFDGFANGLAGKINIMSFQSRH
ncbi:hypothetical protein V498_08289 [Pseudogymnoascus sp. VKM F-4517 (FW-2822)]|nr:hypothetical protein V498_08289 [Pseudogymnoascus sp. VKM F-4517 (FW-2822)]